MSAKSDKAKYQSISDIYGIDVLHPHWPKGKGTGKGRRKKKVGRDGSERKPNNILPAIAQDSMPHQVGDANDDRTHVHPELERLPAESVFGVEPSVDLAFQSSSISGQEYLEGEQRERLAKYYERDPELRKAAIAFHGAKCAVCGFDFAVVYGEHGAGYVEVHHLRPISSLKGETKIDFKCDLTVLCSNCHSMVHRSRDTVLTPDELRAIIRANQH